MAYKKTAKDIAWDNERNKLKSEISKWVQIAANKQTEINDRDQEIRRLNNEVESLREAITTLTNGTRTPEEILQSMEKAANLSTLFNSIKMFGSY